MADEPETTHRDGGSAQGPPRERVRVARLGAPPGVELIGASWVDQAFPRHVHDTLVIGVNVAGVASFTCRGRLHVAPPGHVALIDAGEAHTGERVAGPVWEYRGIHVPSAYLRRVASETTVLHGATPVFDRPLVRDPDLADEVVRVYAALEESDDPMEQEARIQHLVVRVMARYADFPLRSPRAGGERRAVRLAREHLEENLARGATLDELADVAGLSKYHLLRVFAAEVGLPPHAYLLSRRIRRARELLAAGRSIAETAAAVGFADQAHFTRRFKKIVGITPGAWVDAVRR